MKRTCSIALILMTLLSAVMVLPAYAGEADRPWTIYFNPGVRFGTDNRTLYIMDFLVPLYQGDKNILFFNPRFTPNDVNGWEVNLGFGYRQLLFDDKLILGGNFFYDRRRTGWGTSHEQIGLGLEAMTEINKDLALTARFNYYIPTTGAIVADGITGTLIGDYLHEDGVYGLYDNATLTRAVEEPLQGFDAELGVRVPYVSNYLETWVYGGGYHYWGHYIGNVNGVTARLELVPTDFVRLAYEYRYDNISHGNHYGEVMFEVPFSVENLVAGKNPFEGFGKRLSGSRELSERLVEPVRRDVDVKVQGKSLSNFVGDGYWHRKERVVFVSDSGSDSTGSGTFTSPYRTIMKAITNLGNATTIHVMHESGDNLFAGGGIIFPNVTLWGSGVANPKYPTIVNFSATDAPIISNSVLHLYAPGIMVTGFRFQGGGDDGNSGIAAIVIEQYSDRVVICNNEFSIIGDAQRISGIYGNGGVGSGGTPMLIKDNTFTIESTYTGSSLSSSEAYGIALYGGVEGNVAAKIEHNYINILSTSEHSFTFFATARADGTLGYVKVSGSVGTHSQPFYMIDNYGTLSSPDGGVRGLLRSQPMSASGGSIDTFAVLSDVRLGTGAGLLLGNNWPITGIIGCNYGGVYDPWRNPAMYVHTIYP